MFKPVFTISPAIAKVLMRLEVLCQEINKLPITPTVLAGLRETARLSSTHYSTMIEGNRLSEQEVEEVIKQDEHFPGRERDQKEVLGYYAALEELEKLIKTKSFKITEHTIKLIHALVMNGGKKKVKPTHYRDGQNVIRDGKTRRIVYLPPQAPDVPGLMKDLVSWINNKSTKELPCPLQAAIVHYQFATIHPYYDGNGRTARLLTTLVLQLCGYGLKGLYSLEEYYAKSLHAYYEALNIGPSHNYYEGRAHADITPWMEYFVEGMLESFESVKKRALQAQEKGEVDLSFELSHLDARQRSVLALFKKKKNITSEDIRLHFKLKPRTARELCKKWVKQHFLVIAHPSKKLRTYQLAQEIRRLIKV